ncbi:MAG: hypothetical protein ACYDEY_00960 [Acidimicrobiales bacterium]
MVSTIFGFAAPMMTSVIRSDQMTRRSAASASRKLGVDFLVYHGRGIHVGVVPKVGMYQAG